MHTLCKAGENEDSRAATEIQKQQKVLQVLLSNTPQSCPLSPCYFNEGRWPGSDGCITEDEKEFLEKLDPTPGWWQKAWGRRQ